MRIIILLIIYLVCVVSPGLINFISLSGALFNSTLGFLLPILLHSVYFKKTNRLSNKKKYLNYSLLVIGGIMSFIAVVDSSLKLFKLKQ